MNVLQLNTYVTLNGGSETVMDNIGQLLKGQGHTVLNVGFESHKVKHFMADPISLGPEKIDLKTFFFNSGLVEKILDIIRQNNIELVICHNVYHKYPLADLLKTIKEKTDATLMMIFHDYKAVCPRNNLYNGKSICTACSNGKFYNVIKYKCRFGSTLQSGLLAMESYYNNSFRKAYTYPDILVSPSRFLADQFHSMGFPGKINVMNNPIQVGLVPRLAPKMEKKGTYLYAGRLTQDKGLDLFLSLIPKFPDLTFNIAGHGELLDQVVETAAKHTNLNYLGVLNRQQLFQQFDETDFLVLPAIWYENNPMIIIESMASGLPVIASNLGGIPELLEDGRGLLFDPQGDQSIADAIGRSQALSQEQYQVMAGKARAFSEGLDFNFYYKKLEALVPGLKIKKADPVVLLD